MKERPIIFSGEMVRAILEGRKTQTRRIIKDIGDAPGLGPIYKGSDDRKVWVTECPHGQIGDRLWVRETYQLVDELCVYAATPETNHLAWNGWKWKSPIFMPRKLSRITLEITNIRAERLQEISEEDAVAEGILSISKAYCDKKIHQSDLYSFNQYDDITAWSKYPALAYKALWESINGKGSWDLNPWVWVIEFRRVW